MGSWSSLKKYIKNFTILNDSRGWKAPWQILDFITHFHSEVGIANFFLGPLIANPLIIFCRSAYL
jgi:hypothetical protein